MLKRLEILDGNLGSRRGSHRADEQVRAHVVAVTSDITNNLRRVRIQSRAGNQLNHRIEKESELMTKTEIKQTKIDGNFSAWESGEKEPQMCRCGNVATTEDGACGACAANETTSLASRVEEDSIGGLH